MQQRDNQDLQMDNQEQQRDSRVQLVGSHTTETNEISYETKFSTLIFLAILIVFEALAEYGEHICFGLQQLEVPLYFPSKTAKTTLTLRIIA